MLCPWCTGNLGKKNFKEFNRSKVINHLIVLEDSKGDTHVHGPIENAYLMKKFINSILTEVDKRNVKVEIEGKKDG